MRHVSAALGSSVGPLIGSSTAWLVNVPELPLIGRAWPSLRTEADQSPDDGIDLIDLQPTDAEVVRLRREVTRVRRS